MRQTKVAQRYSKALFDLAIETGKVEAVKHDLDLIKVFNLDCHSEI